jgi:hypothetical protein
MVRADWLWQDKMKEQLSLCFNSHLPPDWNSGAGLLLDSFESHFLVFEARSGYLGSQRLGRKEENISAIWRKHCQSSFSTDLLLLSWKVYVQVSHHMNLVLVHSGQYLLVPHPSKLSYSLEVSTGQTKPMDWVTSHKTEVCKITYFRQFAEVPVLPSGPHRPQISLTLPPTLVYLGICSRGQDPPNITNFVETNRKRQCRSTAY